jgi:hypothetical protein
MTDVPEPDSTQQAMPAAVRRGPRWGVIALVIVLIVGAGAFAGWWFLLRSPGPECVVQRFIDSANAGDCDRMLSHLTRKSARNLVKESGGKEGLKRAMQEGGELVGSKVSRATYRNGGKAALVKMELKTKEGSTVRSDTTDIVMVREGGRWKIDMDATIDLAFAKSLGAGSGTGG